jgi:hypothetical protein
MTWPVLKMAIKSIRFLNTDGDLNLRINRDWRLRLGLLIDDCVCCGLVLPTFIIDRCIGNARTKLGAPYSCFSGNSVATHEVWYKCLRRVSGFPTSLRNMDEYSRPCRQYNENKDES